MGLNFLRKKEKDDDFSFDESFEFLSQDLRNDKVPDFRRDSGASSLLQGFVWGFLVFLILGGGIYIYTNFGKIGEVSPFTFVEVRVLDDLGHPVAGAKIKIDGEPKGFTDSFGEWRQYFKFPSGSVQKMAISKERRGKKVVENRTIEIPRLKDSEKEIELKFKVEMALNGRPFPKPVALVESSGSEPKEVRKVSLKLQKEEPKKRKLNTESFFQPNLKSIGISYRSARLKRPNQLSRYQKDVVEKKLYPDLKKYFKDIGIPAEPESPWQVSMQYIPLRNKVGFIQTRVTYDLDSGAQVQRSFIQGFKRTVPETTRKLVNTLRMYLAKNVDAFYESGHWFVLPPTSGKLFWQVNSSKLVTNANGEVFPLTSDSFARKKGRLRVMTADQEPCAQPNNRDSCLFRLATIDHVPPINGWKRLKLRILGKLPKNSNVYVSGFSLLGKEGDSFVYWGYPGRKSNLTIIKDGQVVFRKKIRDSLKKIPHVSLPTRNISMAKPNLKKKRAQ